MTRITATPRKLIVCTAVVLLALPLTAARATDRPPRDSYEILSPTDVPPGIADEVEDALAELAPLVGETSHPDALRTAFRAYYAYRAGHPKRVRKPYFYFVDYGLDNATPRGWVFDMAERTLVAGPFNVAHGRGSSDGRNGVPTRFSNRPGSAMTSLGLYVTQETYGFRGSAGGRRYRSVGLRLAGVSASFNDAARRRGVVAHGAPYVTARDAGRSEGCPALPQHLAKRLLPMIAEGSLVFLYSPNDSVWLTGDPWASVS